MPEYSKRAGEGGSGDSGDSKGGGGGDVAVRQRQKERAAATALIAVMCLSSWGRSEWFTTRVKCQEGGQISCLLSFSFCMHINRHNTCTFASKA